MHQYEQMSETKLSKSQTEDIQYGPLTSISKQAKLSSTLLRLEIYT